MGKRSRKRDRGPAAVADEPRAEAAPRTRPRAAQTKPGARQPTHRRPPLDERPKAPWDPFPLVELCVLLGLIIAAAGLIFVGGERGMIMLLCGLVLCSLAGLDTAVREHWAGYRSHSTLLAGMLAVLAGALVAIATLPPIGVLGVAVIVFACAFAYFRNVFAKRAGVGWRA